MRSPLTKSKLVVVGCVLLAGCVKVRTPVAPATASSLDTARAAVAAPNRSADDRALDSGRRPADLLAFIGVRPGMRVAELGAGGGYTSELLARAVAPGGVVYAQNNRFVLERFAEKP